MKIAIASGKGGTGKTTLATNLALTLAGNGRSVAYLDCDVEEPNGHLFLAPEIGETREVTIPVPVIDTSRCTNCGACGAACRYSAILCLPESVITFPELCHGCGGCTIACEEHAITETGRRVGTVETGRAAEGILFGQGLLQVGESMAPPVLHALLEAAPSTDVTLLDAPPGTSCPAIATIRAADVVVLVTEPTPFGLNDLKLAVEMVRALGLPFGVVVNRAGAGDERVQEYCAAERIEVWLEIPDDRGIAERYSRGEAAVDSMPELRRALSRFADRIVTSADPRPAAARHDLEPFEEPEGLPPTPSQRAPAPACTEIDELVVISGKGGTGKTSVAASLLALAGNAIAADCDVDAADLHLVLDPRIRDRWPFSSGHKARIDEDECAWCTACAQFCRFDAIDQSRANGAFSMAVDPFACEGCGVCTLTCPGDAIELLPVQSGEWFHSDTRLGPMVHARLGVAGENSGKLVSLVRNEARAVAAAEGKELVIVDGSPGIGCPVIASITGARLALVVTEPTLSGLHALLRVAELTGHFGVETAVCVNKFDLNPGVAERIEREAQRLGLTVLGRIHYDPAVTGAQVGATSVTESGPGPAARDIAALWKELRTILAARDEGGRLRRA